MKSVVVIFLMSLLWSCATPKEYQIGNKMVTKKKYDRVSDRVTRKFIKNSKPEHLRAFMEMEIVYDTTTSN